MNCLCTTKRLLPQFFTRMNAIYYFYSYMNIALDEVRRHSHFVRAMTMPSLTLDIRGMECSVHSWNGTSDNPRAIVVVYHGFLAHKTYPTVRYAAELLAANGYAVIAADLPGHGTSPGTRGYLPSADTLIQDGVAIAEFARNTQNDASVPMYLVGSSMGGTIALSVAMQLGDLVSGVVLLAPMLAINVGQASRCLLKVLSYIAPTLSVIPSSSTNAEKQYRDEAKRKECEEDELSIPGSTIRIGSACTCVELATNIQQDFEKITTPFLCMVATEDVVVDNAGAMELMNKSPSKDKTLKEYAALHGLLCEPSPLVDEIHSDLLAWLNERSK
jgi:acylglycerol lipase